MSTVVVGKQLELLREVMPGASQIAVLWNPANRVFQEQQLREAQAAAQRLRLTLHPVEMRSADALERAFAAAASQRMHALLVLADPLFGPLAERMARSALAARLAIATGSREYVEAGMLMAYGPNYIELHRRAAQYVDRILKGARPADLPVEQPTKFELAINLKAARNLGLKVPQTVLLRADTVIE